MEHCHSNKSNTTIKTSAQATLHCLTGCTIGEIIGLMLGVSLNLPVLATMGLATLLAFVIGMGLAIRPIMKNEKLNFKSAFKVIWLGEVISIAVMEVVMNAVDFWMGGMQVNSIMHPMFWISLGVAVPAGFVAAWPVNFWLLKKELKACHSHD